LHALIKSGLNKKFLFKTSDATVILQLLQERI